MFEAASFALALSLATQGVPHHQKHPPAHGQAGATQADDDAGRPHARHHGGHRAGAAGGRANEGHGGGKAARHKAAPTPAPSHGNGDGAEDLEDVEAVEDVTAVDVQAGSAAAADASAEGRAAAPGDKTDLHFNVVMGHLHAAVVHLPIAWLALWSTFEAFAIVWAHPWLVMAGLPMGLVTTLSFAPAVLTGLMRLDELAGASSGYDVGAAHLHRNLLFVAWALVVLACGMRLTVARPGRGVAARGSYILLVWLAFVLTGWSAHLGGCMVYGDDFLPF